MTTTATNGRNPMRETLDAADNPEEYSMGQVLKARLAQFQAANQDPERQREANNIFWEMREFTHRNEDLERAFATLRRLDLETVSPGDLGAIIKTAFGQPAPPKDVERVVLTGKDYYKQEPPAMEWLVQDWLPTGEVSMLTGHGEIGKSRLALQLSAALACDAEVVKNCGGWLPPNKGDTAPSEDDTTPALPKCSRTVVYAAWEDSGNEILRRLNRMAGIKRNGVTISTADWGARFALHPSVHERLYIVPMRGRGPLFGVEQGVHMARRAGVLPGGNQLFDYAAKVDTDLLVLDPSSLALSVSEGDRAAVSLALETLSGWAAETGAAVLLLSHPPKYDNSDGRESSGYSGSSAWRGLCRALWYLHSPKGEAEEVKKVKAKYREMKEGIAELELLKSNYSYSNGVNLTLETVGKSAVWRHRRPVAEMDIKSNASRDRTYSGYDPARPPGSPAGR